MAENLTLNTRQTWKFRGRHTPEGFGTGLDGKECYWWDSTSPGPYVGYIHDVETFWPKPKLELDFVVPAEPFRL